MNRSRPTAQGILRAAPIVVLVGVIECLTSVRLGSAAEWVCRAALRLDASIFANQMAYVRAARGDVEGALRLLQESLPGDQWLFFRLLHTGLICDQAGQAPRAAAFLEQALAAPSPVPVSNEWRAHMTARISRLRERAR